MCGFERIDCDFKCGQKIQRNRLKAHQINTCSKRMISCSYCARDFTADTLQSHHTKCPRFPVPCPFRCGLKSASNGPDGVGKFESLDNDFSNLALSSPNDFSNLALASPNDFLNLALASPNDFSNLALAGLHVLQIWPYQVYTFANLAQTSLYFLQIWS